MAALRIGLTGGIGSGKSTVAGMLAQHGASIIDADAISRACTAANGSAMPQIAARFGAAFIASDGSLDRNAMRELVFSDPLARQHLQAIIHPLVLQTIAQESAAATALNAPCIVVDIPLLVESKHWRQVLHRVLVVDCSETTQIARVCERNAMSASAVRKIIAAQASRNERLRAADIVLCNDGINFAQLHKLVLKIGQQFGL